jgi:uncharacterized protein YodC (DUF2158 family)
MNNGRFNPGDVVQLNSGGPQMTVSKTLQDGDVLVQWFEGMEAKSHCFPGTSLRKVP